jgi:hypothetical protein
MKRPIAISIVIGIGIFAVLAIILYWVAWFFAPSVVQARTSTDSDYAIYVGYEQAFPLPDLFVAVASFVGVLGLWRMRDWGFLSILLAAGGAIFLGLEDLLYDLQHHMFTPFNGAAAIELAIVLVIMGLGPSMIVLLWRHRKEIIQ